MSRSPAIRIPTRHRCSSVARWRRRTIRSSSRSAGRMRHRSARSRSIRTARGRRNSSVPRPRCPCSNCRRASWCPRCRIQCNTCPVGRSRCTGSTARSPTPLRCHHGRPNHRCQHPSRLQPRCRPRPPMRTHHLYPRMRTCRPARLSPRRLPLLLCRWRHRCRRYRRPPRLGRRLLRYRSPRCTSPGRMSRPRPSVRQSCCTPRDPLRSLGLRARRPSVRSCSPLAPQMRDCAFLVPLTRKPRPDPRCRSRCAFSGCRRQGPDRRCIARCRWNLRDRQAARIRPYSRIRPGTGTIRWSRRR